MQFMNVAVVGGGPAGLFLARLLRLRDPAGRVVVYERNPPDAAYGFGVVLSDRTMTRLRTADPPTTRRLEQVSVSWTGMELRREGEVIQYTGHGLTAISRKTLLRILQEQATEVGAELRFGTDVGTPELLRLVADHDVVVLASGANCAVRDLHAREFGTSATDGGGRYIWFGTTAPFDRVSFAFEVHGTAVFAAHAYPYETGRSTYIITTDDDSWRSAGMDASTGQCQRPGESDGYSKRLMEWVFRDHLRGAALLVNNTKWARFRLIRNRRLALGSMVLLGDAAHTSHPSIGSGTKLAMEDALALAEAMSARDTVADALSEYELVRRPFIQRTQRLAEPSMRWWESYRARMHFDLRQLGFHYLTRTGAIDYAGLRRRDPKAVTEVERWFETCHGSPGAQGLHAPHAASVRVSLGGTVLRNRLISMLPPGISPRCVAESAAHSGLVVLSATGDRAVWRDVAAQARARGALTAATVHPGDRAAARLAAEAAVHFLCLALGHSHTDSTGANLALSADAARAHRLGLTAIVRVPLDPLGTGAAGRFAGWCADLARAGISALCLMCEDPERQWEHVLAYADLIRAGARIPVVIPGPAGWAVPEGDLTEADPWTAKLHSALLSGRADLIAREL